jgi:hypothetical protein
MFLRGSSCCGKRAVARKEKKNYVENIVILIKYLFSYT